MRNIVCLLLLISLLSCLYNQTSLKTIRVQQVYGAENELIKSEEDRLAPYVSTINYNVFSKKDTLYKDETVERINESSADFFDIIYNYPFFGLRPVMYYYPLGIAAYPHIGSETYKETNKDTYVASFLGESEICFVIYNCRGIKLDSELHSLSVSSSCFEGFEYGSNYRDVLALDLAGDYGFITRGRTDQPKVSYHFTSDGFVLLVCYNDDYEIVAIYKSFI